MLKDGTYSAWFKTSLGQGTGLVHLADGKLRGRDSFLLYDGSYQTDGDLFTATVRTRRHTAGQPAVFGVDELELKIAGTARGRIATCTGTAAAAPGMVMEVTLVPCESPPTAPEPPQASSFDAGRLLKLPRLPR